VIDL